MRDNEIGNVHCFDSSILDFGGRDSGGKMVYVQAWCHLGLVYPRLMMRLEAITTLASKIRFLDLALVLLFTFLCHATRCSVYFKVQSSNSQAYSVEFEYQRSIRLTC